MKHLSLFSGIGGFDLASQWVGWDNVAQVEKDEWCRKVLAKNFPNSKQYADIKNFDGKEYTNKIDVVSGGFPCQPFSVAGQRKGKEDDRYLWEEMLRVNDEIKPAFIVGENVTGIIGLALDTVLSDLEAHGYTTETFIIPACGKNAWHRRDRVWIVAYSNSIRWKDEQEKNIELLHNRNRNSEIEEQGGRKQQCGAIQSSTILSNTDSSGFQAQRAEQQTAGTEQHRTFYREWWETEPSVGRVANGIPNRVDRLRGLGNAIVPQVAYEIFKAINQLTNDIYV